MGSSTNYKEYHEYLKKTSFLGKIYRKVFLFPFLRFKTGPRFVDLGCGIGDFLSYGDKGSVGLDTNIFNINFLKDKHLNGYHIEDDGIFPLKDNSFKVVISDQVLEHIVDPRKFISEIKRILKKGGKIIIGVPCKKGFQIDPDHKVFYELDNLKDLFLSDPKIRITDYFYFPFPFKFFGKFIKIQSLYMIFKYSG